MIRRYLSRLIIIVLCIVLLNGCAWIAGVAIAGAAASVVFSAGSVADIDKTEKAVAVERLIYAFEANNGIIEDLSFADGYVKGRVDGYKVTANIYARRDGTLDINVRATKYLISNADMAQKILDKYKNYVRR